jgi:hypothetical protein
MLEQQTNSIIATLTDLSTKKSAAKIGQPERKTQRRDEIPRDLVLTLGGWCFATGQGILLRDADADEATDSVGQGGGGHANQHLPRA